MSETTEQRTKRKFKDALNKYQPNYLTSIQFNAEASEEPEYIIELYQKLRKSISKKHDGVLIFWLRTLKTKTQFRFPMICLFTQTPLKIEKVKLMDEYFTYNKLNKEWTHADYNRWINNKEMFTESLFRQFYNLEPNGKRNISRLAIVNKNKSEEPFQEESNSNDVELSCLF